MTGSSRRWISFCRGNGPLVIPGFAGRRDRECLQHLQSLQGDPFGGFAFLLDPDLHLAIERLFQEPAAVRLLFASEDREGIIQARVVAFELAEQPEELENIGIVHQGEAQAQPPGLSAPWPHPYGNCGDQSNWCSACNRDLPEDWFVHHRCAGGRGSSPGPSGPGDRRDGPDGSDYRPYCLSDRG